MKQECFFFHVLQEGEVSGRGDDAPEEGEGLPQSCWDLSCLLPPFRIN